MKKIELTNIISVFFLLLAIPVSSQNEELFLKAAGSPSNPKVVASWKQILHVCRNY